MLSDGIKAIVIERSVSYGKKPLHIKTVPKENCC